MLRPSTIYAALALVAVSVPATAADQPISGAKLTLKHTATSQKLTFTSKDPAFHFPEPGGTDDPSTAGAVIELFSQAQPGGASLFVPAGSGSPGWTFRDGRTDTFRFTNRAAPGGPSPVRVLTFRSTRGIKIAAKQTGLVLTGPQGFVGIRITTGATRNCARFDAATVRRDVAGLFDARGALAGALVNCSTGQLGGSTTTTTATTSTTTTIAGTCGNGALDPGEQCDGVSQPECPAGGSFLACVPPGDAGECQCCSLTQIDPDLGVPCCEGARGIQLGSNGPLLCVGTRCDGAYPCSDGDQCQPDGSCCTVAAHGCALGPPFDWPTNACCPGLDCRGSGPQSPLVTYCCGTDGVSCGGDQDCCTGHCTSGICEACRPSGVSCTTNAECCSSACSGGTCGGCRAAATACTADVQCCSGSCNFESLICDP